MRRKEGRLAEETKGLRVYDHKWRGQTPAVTCLCRPYSQLLCVCVCVRDPRVVSVTEQALTLWNKAGKGATDRKEL